MKPFSPKSLNNEARGITTVRSTPYGCKVLGEVEGYDGVSAEDRPKPFTSGVYTKNPRLEQAREGALNDLRNKAVDVVGNTKKRITLRIVDETPGCIGKCASELFDDHHVRSYRVTAQIFECGNKE